MLLEERGQIGCIGDYRRELLLLEAGENSVLILQRTLILESVRRVNPAGFHSDVIGQVTRIRKRRDDTGLGFYPDAVGPRCILNVPPRCEARFNYRLLVDPECYWLIAP